jgi:hypothetical protein
MERRTRLALYALLLVTVPVLFVFLLSAGPLGWLLVLFCAIGAALYVYTEHDPTPTRCTNCGATNRTGADQCPYCGSVL